MAEGRPAQIEGHVATILGLMAKEGAAAAKAEKAMSDARAAKALENEAAWQIGDALTALKPLVPRGWKKFIRATFDRTTEWARQRMLVAETYTLDETRSAPSLKRLFETTKPPRKAKPKDEDHAWEKLWAGDTIQTPTPRWQHKGVTLLRGDVDLVTRTFADNSFHGALLDPAYGYGPDKESAAWEVPSIDTWKGIYRVLMPGSLLVASTGKAEELIAKDIEAAGFMLFDSFWWVFPDPDASKKKHRDGWLFVDPYVVAAKVPGDGEAHTGWVLDPAVVEDDNIPPQLRGEIGTVRRGSHSRENLRWIFGNGPPPPTFNVKTWLREGGTEERPLEPGGHFGNHLFYCNARKPKEERAGTDHPTLKPLALTEHMARFIKPPVHDGHLLVPYSGAGSEVIGGVRAGWSRVTGIEREAKFIDDARRRVVRLAAMRT